jgi:hypothetical protein
MSRPSLRHPIAELEFMDMGQDVGECLSGILHRQWVDPFCRVFYGYDGQRVFCVHVMRTMRLLRRSRLARARPSKL